MQEEEQRKLCTFELRLEPGIWFDVYVIPESHRQGGDTVPQRGGLLNVFSTDFPSGLYCVLSVEGPLNPDTMQGTPRGQFSDPARNRFGTGGVEGEIWRVKAAKTNIPSYCVDAQGCLKPLHLTNGTGWLPDFIGGAEALSYLPLGFPAAGSAVRIGNRFRFVQGSQIGTTASGRLGETLVDQALPVTRTAPGVAPSISHLFPLHPAQPYAFSIFAPAIEAGGASPLLGLPPNESTYDPSNYEVEITGERIREGAEFIGLSPEEQRAIVTGEAPPTTGSIWPESVGLGALISLIRTQAYGNRICPTETIGYIPRALPEDPREIITPESDAEVPTFHAEVVEPAFVDPGFAVLSNVLPALTAAPIVASAYQHSPLEQEPERDEDEQPEERVKELPINTGLGIWFNVHVERGDLEQGSLMALRSDDYTEAVWIVLFRSELRVDRGRAAPGRYYTVKASPTTIPLECVLPTGRLQVIREAPRPGPKPSPIAERPSLARGNNAQPLPPNPVEVINEEFRTTGLADILTSTGNIINAIQRGDVFRALRRVARRYGIEQLVRTADILGAVTGGGVQSAIHAAGRASGVRTRIIPDWVQIGRIIIAGRRSEAARRIAREMGLENEARANAIVEAMTRELIITAVERIRVAVGLSAVLDYGTQAAREILRGDVLGAAGNIAGLIGFGGGGDTAQYTATNRPHPAIWTDERGLVYLRLLINRAYATRSNLPTANAFGRRTLEDFGFSPQRDRQERVARQTRGRTGRRVGVVRARRN